MTASVSILDLGTFQIIIHKLETIILVGPWRSSSRSHVPRGRSNVSHALRAKRLTRISSCAKGPTPSKPRGRTGLPNGIHQHRNTQRGGEMDTPPDLSPSEGSAFPWILEHLLAYPGTYEIPLRTMYTNNVLAQTNRPSTPGSTSTNSPNTPFPPQFPGSNSNNRQSTATQAATEHFKSSLMEQIAYLPSQPFSLPPSFITSFVRRCFTEDLCLVDFTQALTALDYLKDLETRRKRELSAALRRLNINVDAIDVERDDRAKRSPAIAEWISSMEDKERKVEALYTQVYIGLRRWVSASFRSYIKLSCFILCLRSVSRHVS